MARADFIRAKASDAQLGSDSLQKSLLTLAPSRARSSRADIDLKIYPTRSGTRFMPGATWTAEGVNFSVFSKSAQKVELLLYKGADSAEPLQILDLDPNTNRTYFFWHVLVVGLRPGIFYTWRIDGKELVDPWARAVTDAVWNRRQAIAHPGGSGNSLRAVVTTQTELTSRESPFAPSLGNAFYTARLIPGRNIPDIVWPGVRLNEPAWHDGNCQFLAFTIAGLTANEADLHVILNLADAMVEAALPSLPGREWYAVVDTADPVTSGVLPQKDQRPVLTSVWQVQPRSVVIFEGRAAGVYPDL
jgi:pullulanase/glycogen debranching enzyme